jgi:hypothetical protein
VSRFVLERDKTRLKVVHRQRVLRQGDADPAPAFERAALDPKILPAAISGWQRLVETEYESVVIAGWMTAGLARFGAPLDIIGAFGRVVEDEIRHVDICAQMVERFGEQPSIERAATPPFPIGVEGPASEESEFELIAGLVGFFCVFEHLSAHVFHAALEAAEHDIAKWAISEIHRDEAFHGAFGFETAKVFVPSWSEARKKQLGERVAADVMRFEQRLGGPLPASPPRDPHPDQTRGLERLGLLSTPDLLSIFYQSVKKELLPRLDELGIAVDLRIAG